MRSTGKDCPLSKHIFDNQGSGRALSLLQHFTQVMVTDCCFEVFTQSILRAFTPIELTLSLTERDGEELSFEVANPTDAGLPADSIQEIFFFDYVREEILCYYLSFTNQETSTLWTLLARRKLITLSSSISLSSFMVQRCYNSCTILNSSLPGSALALCLSTGSSKSYWPFNSRVVGLSCFIPRLLKSTLDESPVVLMLSDRSLAASSYLNLI